MAWGYQEPYLAQVRSIITKFDRYRTTMPRSDRSDWPKLLRSYVIERLVRSRAQTAATVVHWITMISPRLPIPLSRREFVGLVRAISTAKLLRPASRLRGVPGQLRATLESLASRPGQERVWATVLIMASSVRRSDAVRIVGGDIVAPPELVSDAVIIFPSTEKTDQVGAREAEPVVVVCQDAAEAARLHRVLCCPPLSSGALKTLAKSVSASLRSAGIRDVRALRRDAAAAAGGREAANVLLRHRPGDYGCTLRYSGTADRVKRMTRIGAKVRRGRTATKR